MILLLHVLLQGYVYTSCFLVCFDILIFWFVIQQNVPIIQNHSQNILRQTLDLCEVAHKGKSSISVFQEFFTSTDKIFVSVDGLSTRQ